MTKRIEELKMHLKEGSVYRRADLTQWSNAVDRHLNELVKSGYLEKLSVGLYYAPKKSIFGVVPPEDESLVCTFLKEDDFLITSPNAYNSLGVGTTQLYNVRVVYNHKRHGEFDLGGRKFFFHAKHRFPRKLTQEFLLVDLVNNIESLAEDKTEVLTKVIAKAKTMDAGQLRKTVTSYGNTKAKSLFSFLITQKNNVAYAH